MKRIMKALGLMILGATMLAAFLIYWSLSPKGTVAARKADRQAVEEIYSEIQYNPINEFAGMEGQVYR